MQTILMKSLSQIPVAVEYVHHLIALYSTLGGRLKVHYSIKICMMIWQFTESVLCQNFMMQNVWQALMSSTIVT